MRKLWFKQFINSSLQFCVSPFIIILIDVFIISLPSQYLKINVAEDGKRVIRALSPPCNMDLSLASVPWIITIINGFLWKSQIMIKPTDILYILSHNQCPCLETQWGVSIMNTFDYFYVLNNVPIVLRLMINYNFQHCSGCYFPVNSWVLF